MNMIQKAPVRTRVSGNSDNSVNSVLFDQGQEQGLLALPTEIEQRFLEWKETPGGRQLLRFAYQETARFAARFQRTGQRVSMDYIMHILRDRIGRIKARLARSGIALPKVGGYAVNDHFTAHIARHIMTRRPEWDGLFEKRKLGAKRMVAKRKITVTEYAPVRVAPAGVV